MRLMIVPLVLALAVALGACGEDGASSTADDASAEARQIAEATRDLQRDLTATGRQAIADLRDGDTASAVAEENMKRLEDLEQRGRELAERTERELPEDEQTRDSLRRAGEGVVQAAESLQTALRANEEEATASARDALERVDQRLNEVADELEQRLPESARDDLERLRREVPEL